MGKKKELSQQIIDGFIETDRRISRRNLLALSRKVEERPLLFDPEPIPPKILIELLTMEHGYSEEEAACEIYSTYKLMEKAMFLVFKEEASERARRVENVFEKMRKKFKGSKEQYSGLRGMWLYFMGKIFIIEGVHEARKFDLFTRNLYKRQVEQLQKLEKTLLSILRDSDESIARNFIAALLRRRGIQIRPQDLLGLADEIKELSAVWRGHYEYTIAKFGGRGPQEDITRKRDFRHPDVRAYLNGMIDIVLRLKLLNAKQTYQYVARLCFEFGLLDLKHKRMIESERQGRDTEFSYTQEEIENETKELIEKEAATIGSQYSRMKKKIID